MVSQTSTTDGSKESAPSVMIGPGSVQKTEPVPPLGFLTRLWRKLRSRVEPLEIIPPEILADPDVFYCPLCSSRVEEFKDFGDPPRKDAKCPECGAVERHRLVWCFYKLKTNLFDGTLKKVLHVAPERVFASRIAKIPGIDYLSGDLFSPRAMVKLDLTNIQFPEGSFDVVLCSHVLEHIPDDRRAMAEMFRVLRPGGWAAIQVPIFGERTFEDPSVVTPQQRKEVFGQHDHVRLYGTDIAARLAEAGFDVEHCRPLASIDPVLQAKMKLKDQDIFYCRKPA